jgi:glutamate synthase (NADPH/NADH) large chain
MMIPEAWENHAEMDPAAGLLPLPLLAHGAVGRPGLRDLHRRHLIGAVLDRNGLRPGRYWVTDDGLVVLASEAGVLDIDPERSCAKGRLQPGRMFLVDTAAGPHHQRRGGQGRAGRRAPVREWLDAGHARAGRPARARARRPHRRVGGAPQQTFGYTQEELKIILAPMARTGGEPLGSMGTDTPIAVLSDRPRLLFDYFTQLFAQVTNPPLDAIREELVTSLGGSSARGQPAGRHPGARRQVVCPSRSSTTTSWPRSCTSTTTATCRVTRTVVVVKGLYPVSGGSGRHDGALERSSPRSRPRSRRGARFVVLSDRDSNADLAPIPSLLLTAAVHHHLHAGEDPHPGGPDRRGRRRP